jgi:hypothetical protein
MTTDRTVGCRRKTVGMKILYVEATDREDETLCGSALHHCGQDVTLCSSVKTQCGKDERHDRHVETTVRSTKRLGLTVETTCKEAKTTNQTTKLLGRKVGSISSEVGSTSALAEKVSGEWNDV